MYEPIYLPKMGHTLLPGVRVGIVHTKDHIQPDDPIADPMHIHAYAEIFFNIAGDISFLVNNRLYPVGVGDVVISRAKEVHVCVYHKPCLREQYCLWIDAEADSPLLEFLQRENFCPLLSFGLGTQAKLRELLGLMVQGNQIEKTAYLLQILLLLGKKQQSPEQEAPLPQAMQAILDDIRGNFAQIRRVSDLARDHYISPATLNRWFRKFLHTSAREYLETQKLSNAAKLLSDGATVTEACRQSGFSDCSQFIALFKRKFGETPLRYKRNYSSKSTL